MFCSGWIAVALLLTNLGSYPNPLALEGPGTMGIGERAPDFDLPGVDGRNHRLSDFAAAQILVVVFTCNHCPTAQAYEGRIQALKDEYEGKGVALVAISPNDPNAVRLDELGYTDMSDSLEEMKVRAGDRKFTFPYLYDGNNQAVSRAYGPTATPHVFVFDKDRKLRYAGRVDDSEKPDKVRSRDARNAIEALLAGHPVTVQKTKTFGCSIKWSDKRASVKSGFEHWANEPVSLDAIDETGVRALVRNDSKKLRLVNVWATWCGPCVIEFPELITINRMYRERDFELVTISADAPEKKEDALAFLRKQQASSRNYLFSVEDKYKLIDAIDKEWPGALPYTLVIEPGGKVIFRVQGELVPLELKKAIVGKLGRYYP
ncbi:MAG TPA: redoxin domain-containing protein [Acidobacteriota bacterium]|nr:redoxin domain-containing protein [Acidobacteriota bacterium]